MKKFVGFYYRCSLKVFLCAFLSLIGLTALSSSAFALQSGDFTYTVNTDSTVTITGYTGSGGAVVIPSTIDGMPVVGIGDYAFNYRTGMTSVTIPNSVTSIGQYAFGWCSGLTSVTIPNSVTSIGYWVFYECTSLTSIVVDTGNTVYSSQDGVLYNKAKTLLIQCPGGKFGGFTIPDSVTSIESYAFYSCTSLTSVTIPNSVTSIGDYTFKFCTHLTSATIGNRVMSIGDYAFQICTSLTSVTIPDSVTSIGSYAFGSCLQLTSVTIGNGVMRIWDNAFYQCTSLTSVTIPASVTSIGDYAFFLCRLLTSVTIGNSVKSIGRYAFNSCSSLSKAYFIGNAPTMSSGVFDYCASNFSICYTAGSTGFTTPTWYGYPAAVCGETLIELTSFTATPKAGKVFLQWNTESEIENAGFNIYRATAKEGEYTQINESLISAQGSSTQGASYEFTDTDVKNRKTYYYKLEDIDLDGQSTMHGPVNATPRWILGIFRFRN